MINTKLHQEIILLIKLAIKSPLLILLLKDDMMMLNLDDQHKATSKDHPTLYASHLSLLQIAQS